MDLGTWQFVVTGSDLMYLVCTADYKGNLNTIIRAAIKKWKTFTIVKKLEL